MSQSLSFSVSCSSQLSLDLSNEREREEVSTTPEVELGTVVEVEEENVMEPVFELKNTPITALFEYMKDYDTSISEEGDSECEELVID